MWCATWSIRFFFYSFFRFRKWTSKRTDAIRQNDCTVIVCKQRLRLKKLACTIDYHWPWFVVFVISIATMLWIPCFIHLLVTLSVWMNAMDDDWYTFSQHQQQHRNVIVLLVVRFITYICWPMGINLVKLVSIRMDLLFEKKKWKFIQHFLHVNHIQKRNDLTEKPVNITN